MPTGFAISRPIQARRTREIDDGIGIECSLEAYFKMPCIEFSLAKTFLVIFQPQFSRILALECGNNFNAKIKNTYLM